MIKVLFLIPTLGHGGAERVLVNLVNNMDKAVFDVTVQTLFDEGVNKQYLHSDIHYKTFMKHQFHGNSRLFALIPSKWLYKRIVKEQYDILVSYLEGPTAHVIAGCDNDAVKKVAWIHIELNNIKLFKQGFATKNIAVNSYRKFDRIVCVSKTVKEVFLSTSLSTFRSVDVLYNTNETISIKKAANEVIYDIPFNNKTVDVCSVAKLMDSKGFDRLIQAHVRLLGEGLNHRILVIGEGEKRKELERFIEENGLHNSFILLGFQKNPYKYMAACDLYICSSRREGFSTAVTESLIVGTPVVSTCCSGAYELLGDKVEVDNDSSSKHYDLCEYGIVTENSEEGIYEGLKRMITDASLREHYAEMAQIRGQKFDTKKTVNAVEKMLVDVYEGE